MWPSPWRLSWAWLQGRTQVPHSCRVHWTVLLLEGSVNCFLVLGVGAICHGRPYQRQISPDNIVPWSLGHTNPSTVMRWWFFSRSKSLEDRAALTCCSWADEWYLRFYNSGSFPFFSFSYSCSRQRSHSVKKPSPEAWASWRWVVWLLSRALCLTVS